MKQVLQDARTGDLRVTDVPAPQMLPGCVLVRTAASLVSVGTERASAEFARKNLLSKAKARPDLVRDVMAKIQRDGLTATVGAVRSRLSQPQSVGYSSAGVVIAVGDGVPDINAGDRVACAGAGYAAHAELACVPRLLVAKIPATRKVSFDEAVFGTVGAICLHGIRTAGVGLGDTVAVIGLGLLGQITIQLLQAAGCRVLGMDLDAHRVDLAIQSGANAACSSANGFRDLCDQETGGAGADAVLITAETPSSDPVNLAAEVARDRAIVVAVGTVGMELERKLYYEKELDFRISRSYGPGRYDTAYEQKGRDYPIGHVRWTETRNLEAFLRFIAEGKLDLAPLITHRFPMDQAARAYDLITGRSAELFLGVLLEYPNTVPAADHLQSPNSRSVIDIGSALEREEKMRQSPEFSREAQGFRLATPQSEKILIAQAGLSPDRDSIGIGILGAGAFAQSTLLPALKSTRGVSFVGVCNATGPGSRNAAEKFGFDYCSNSEDELLRDPKINALVIATRHHLHAAQVLAAIQAGKAVFCEKPLCLHETELASIVRAISERSSPPHAVPPVLMVGFNRRYAPMATQMKAFLSDVHEPLSMHYRVNAGYIPAHHWVNDPEQGGGRIVGEVCHFVDFLCFLAGEPPIQVQAEMLGNRGQYSADNMIATLKFADGTLGTITYMANGDRSASKERLEVFGGGSVAILEDFRRLELVRNGRKQIARNRWAQDKGHKHEMREFVSALQRKTPPRISPELIVASTLATLRLQNACQLGQALDVDVREFMTAAVEDNSTQ
jgi:predicted dehydrogenase/threonine dehydrogenase-like Zn-dependent dehydrogenase